MHRSQQDGLVGWIMQAATKYGVTAPTAGLCNRLYHMDASSYRDRLYQKESSCSIVAAALFTPTKPALWLLFICHPAQTSHNVIAGCMCAPLNRFFPVYLAYQPKRKCVRWKLLHSSKLLL